MGKSLRCIRDKYIENKANKNAIINTKESKSCIKTKSNYSKLPGSIGDNVSTDYRFKQN